MSAESVRLTLGAALAGCMVAVGLSAVLGFQTFLYFNIFPSDARRYKFLVGWIWAADAIHTVMICSTIWEYLIVNFSNPDIVTKIFPTVGITVAMTAVTTLSANSFYGWRIHKLSKQNWWLTGPIIFLSIARVGLAFATTSELIIMKTYPAFREKFQNLFTSGLIVSAVTDVIVSFARYYYLRNLKQGYMPTQEAVDAVVVFTLNDGILTCAVVIAAIACWLSMPHNFIYLGIYFTISKLYSNSVLATLNLRNWYRHRYAWTRPLGLSRMRGTTTGMNHGNSDHSQSMLPTSHPTDKHAPPSESGLGVEVYVERQVEYISELIGNSDLDVPETHSSKSRKSMDISPERLAL
ncbi:hypothetical protein BDP27DRAFT_1421123 [Rhodocollybia butyracea]|uniref:DUF6534 domain-containing protein n=1 Tax=Rhodocollybia butyracea TaxID=206335 RepID=A0A9P5PSR3_9AGAR|nr:hypothetical protein BDP27DRAFT_1421123 [Rhodocollybia butyracea]